jgi:pSer/pThr/pTyr-binding forkhead associated (FHA) protein
MLSWRGNGHSPGVYALPMEVKLIVEEGAHAGQTFRLRAAETIVGRRRGCGLRIPSDSVSRRHCRLTFRDDYLTVDDLASVNGTKVNGELIAKPTIVHPGDRLSVGSITFLVQYQLTPKAIERLLEAQQHEAESLPTFDANESSLPVALSDESSLPSLKKQLKKQPKKKSVPAKKRDEEQNPDASVVFGGRNWQLPSGKDIRDILSELDKE